jgi:hypothetical protein
MEIDNIPGSASSYVLTNLQNFTNYEVRVRSRCNGVLSPSWSEVATFRTLQNTVGSCRKVGGLYVNQVNGANSVDVNWNADPTAVCYDVQYGLSSSNPSTWTIVSSVSTNSFRITGLTPGFSYGVRVRANCLNCPASDNNRSQYSDLVSFSVDNLRGEVSDATSVTNYTVYPNPTTGVLNVDFETLTGGNLEVRVLDLAGRVVTRTAVETLAGSNSFSVDLSGNPAGIYMLQLQQGERVETVKVILK